MIFIKTYFSGVYYFKLKNNACYLAGNQFVDLTNMVMVNKF